MIPNLVKPTREEIIQYLQEKGFETKDDQGQIRTNKCPFCQTDKIDWTHFYISYSGLHHCHRCGNSGNIITLVQHFGDYTSKDFSNSKHSLNEEVKAPDEIKLEAPKKEPELDLKFQAELESSAEIYHKTLMDGFNSNETVSDVKEIIKYLTETRGLKKETLEYFKIGWTGTSISIPLIENNKVVNIRFRKNPFNQDENIPKMVNTKGGKMTLFNVDCLKNPDTKVVITEGEIDAMSLIQEGWDRVISVTCGAKTFKEEWVEILKKEKSIYLAYDNDLPGQDGLKIAVEKLGAGKCFRILLPDENGTIKDLNDFFIKAKKTIDDFVSLYNKADKIKIEYAYIQDIKQATKETIEQLKNPQKLRGLPTGYPQLDDLWKGMRDGNLIVISGDTNVGKCHAKGTKILMFDGSLKKVEDIKIGDELMGIDSKPRKVLSLARGKDLMYKITPLKGAESFIVNKEHILSLKKNTKKYPHYPKFLELSITNYLKLASKRKHVYKLWHSNKINFKEKKLLIDPYFLGLWLGDGTSSNPCITSADKEVEIWLEKYAKKLNLKINRSTKNGDKASYYCLTREKKFDSVNKCKGGKYVYKNNKTKIGGYGNIKSLREYLKKLNLLNNKHIPFSYKINSEKNRLELLAGLIDSDGSKDLAGYSFYNNNKKLCEDTIFIARSLGFFASTIKEKYTTCNSKKFKSYKIYISGDVERIPLKIKRKITQKRKNYKNWLTTGFKIKKLKKGDYYGFNLDKDKLYLLDNFIVNHNSFLCQNIILNLANLNKKTILFSLEQPIEEMVERFMMLDSKLDYQGEILKDEGRAISLLTQAGTKLEKKPIYFYSGYDKLEPKLLGEVTEKAVRDFGCELVVIDHLHYFAIGDRKQRTTEIGDIVRYVKLLARKYNIPIILVCHIRKLEVDGKMPTMEDLKDSSAIKQDADIVALLFRERNNNRQLKDSFVLNTDKNRHGKSGMVRFTIDNFCRFHEDTNSADGSDNKTALGSNDDEKKKIEEVNRDFSSINLSN
jgi:replicative DNA helicase